MPKKPPVTPPVSIKTIQFSGGEKIQLNPNDKVLLTGPNNVGKSLALSEIMQLSRRDRSGAGHHPYKVIQELDFDKSGSAADVKAYLEASFSCSENGVYRYGGTSFSSSDLHKWQTLFSGRLAEFFVKHISASSRLGIVNLSSSIAVGRAPQTPQHVLYNDEELMEKVSALFKAAFNQDLFFNYRGGSQLPIHVGEKPDFDADEDRISGSYVEKVCKFPLLHGQGDGVKSYAGLLFETVATKRSVTLIDEPEAFLHPPQMRRLGEMLAQEVAGQMIIATHSSDIMRGFLNGAQGDSIRILRMQKQGDKNHVQEVHPEEIKDLWGKTALRYSNAFDGIFHEQALICESASDCRLVHAVADHLEAEASAKFKDTAYIPAGGKHAIPKIAKILRQTGLPVKAIFDADVLREENVVKDTVTAFGGDWDEIQPLLKKISDVVEDKNKNPPLDAAAIKATICEIVKDCKGNETPSQREIVKALNQAKPWDNFKRNGKTALPRGDILSVYKQLDGALKALGVFVIPCGEIESFSPETGGHGEAFVTKLLEADDLDRNTLKDLREFVDGIIRADLPVGGVGDVGTA